MSNVPVICFSILILIVLVSHVSILNVISYNTCGMKIALHHDTLLQ